MKVSEVSADLYCATCLEETAHKLVYVNGKLQKSQCEKCGRLMKSNVNVNREFYKDIYNRVSTKPHKIKEEYRQDHKVVLKLFIRIITKPYRFIRDLVKDRKQVKELKDK